MGSFIEINDTLQLTKDQGFPKELDITTHIKTPFHLKDVQDKTFSFTAKKDIRVYKCYPIRNFLVENVEGKWIYWGLAHVIEITHDYVNKTTSGKFKIIRLNTVEEMKQMFALADMRPEKDYFNQ